MNLRRMRRASFFLSLLPSTWFVLLFCCGAMSLSALLSSKDERDKLIVARTPKKTVQATDFWSRSFQKYALESKNVPDLLALSKAKAFMSKNHQGGLIGSNHVSVGCIQDPIQVEALDLYLSKLHPSLDRFFQRAKVPPGTTLNDSHSHSHWYVNSPISHNLLNQFMKRISEQAHLSTLYTNHCLRATTIVHLKEAGVEDRKICEISGHKNPASLTAYDRTSAERAVDLSAAIDTKRVAPAPANPPSPLSDIMNSPSASGFLFNAGNVTFNNVTFNFAPPPPKKRKVSRERLQLKKTRERLLQSRTAEGEFSTAERTTVELSGSTS